MAEKAAYEAMCEQSGIEPCKLVRPEGRGGSAARGGEPTKRCEDAAGAGVGGRAGPAALAAAAINAAKTSGTNASAARARALTLRLTEPSGAKRPEPQGVLPLADFGEARRVLAIWAATQVRKTHASRPQSLNRFK